MRIIRQSDPSSYSDVVWDTLQKEWESREAEVGVQSVLAGKLAGTFGIPTAKRTQSLRVAIANVFVKALNYVSLDVPTRSGLLEFALLPFLPKVSLI